MKKLVVASTLGCALVVSACSGQGSPGRVPTAGRTSSWSPPWPQAAPYTPDVQTPTTATATTTTPACDTPSKDMLEWAGYAMAPHPGPVTASAQVFAATTKTGDWYVVALDRAYVHDNGTLAGGHSRDLGLTNGVTARTKDSKLIPISRDDKGTFAVVWDKVSWDGATLEAGKAAAEQALACLDAHAKT